MVSQKLTMTGFEPAPPDPKAGALPFQLHGLSLYVNSFKYKCITQTLVYHATIVTIRAS